MRYLKEEDIDHIAVGAAILGSGGGGDPHIGKLMAMHGLADITDPQLVY
jgi:DUF917 family protein